MKYLKKKSDNESGSRSTPSPDNSGGRGDTWTPENYDVYDRYGNRLGNLYPSNVPPIPGPSGLA